MKNLHCNKKAGNFFENFASWLLWFLAGVILIFGIRYIYNRLTG